MEKGEAHGAGKSETETKRDGIPNVFDGDEVQVGRDGVVEEAQPKSDAGDGVALDVRGRHARGDVAGVELFRRVLAHDLLGDGEGGGLKDRLFGRGALRREVLLRDVDEAVGGLVSGHDIVPEVRLMRS